MTEYKFIMNVKTLQGFAKADTSKAIIEYIKRVCSIDDWYEVEMSKGETSLFFEGYFYPREKYLFVNELRKLSEKYEFEIEIFLELLEEGYYKHYKLNNGKVCVERDKPSVSKEFDEVMWTQRISEMWVVFDKLGKFSGNKYRKFIF